MRMPSTTDRRPARRTSRRAAPFVAGLLATAMVLAAAPAEAYGVAGKSKAQDPTMQGVGIAMTSLGLISLLVGGILVGAGSSGNTRDDAGYTGAGLPMQLTGLVMLPVGGILTGIGIPLWAVGGAAADEEEEEESAARTPAAELPSARVELASGGVRLVGRW